MDLLRPRVHPRPILLFLILAGTALAGCTTGGGGGDTHGNRDPDGNGVNRDEVTQTRKDPLGARNGTGASGVANMTHPLPGSIAYRPQVLREAGTVLEQAGLYEPGKRAVYGLAFQDALRLFQRERNLPATGMLDGATLKALGIDADPASIVLAPHEIPDPSPGVAAPRFSISLASPLGLQAPPDDAIEHNEEVSVPDATAVRLFIGEFTIRGPGALQFVSPDGKVLAQYTEQNAKDARGTWTDWFDYGSLVVRLRLSDSASGSFSIGRAQAILDDATQDGSDPESIIDTDDSSSIGAFAPGSEIQGRGAAVGTVIDAPTNAEYCSGFLIGPDRFMTNNHCLSTQAECDDTAVRFNYQDDAAGNPLVTTTYDCVSILQTNWELDYTVMELDDNAGYEWGILRLTRDNVHVGERLTIIGHPAGLPKRVSNDPCHVTEAISNGRGTGTDISYDCDTRGGSSGSAVFDLRHFEVIALHHTGLGRDADNEGVRMRKVLADCNVCPPPYSAPGKRFDVDGDGRQDAFIRSPDWAGVVRSTPTGFETSWIQGGWAGGWNLGAPDWDMTGDIDGDGNGDVVLRSPDWIGTLTGSGSQLDFEWIQGGWLGGWNLGFDDDTLVGDFNDDGRDDVLLRSDEWLGLALSDGSGMQLEWIQSDWVGGWNLGRADRFWVGDFTGDGRDDVFVRSPEWAGLLRSTGTELEQVWIQFDWLDGWNMGEGDDHYVGDFDGDGRDDLFTRSNDWASIWTFDGASFSVSWMRHDWVDSWNMGWVDRHHVGDFNGDGRDDVLARSPEWIAIMTSSGSGLSTTWIQFDWLGAWNLGGVDNERVGDFNGDGSDDVLVRSPEWIGRFRSSGASLTQDFIQHDWLGSWNMGQVDRLAGGS